MNTNNTGRKRELTILGVMAGVFLGCFFLPVGNLRFNNAAMESLYLTRWYAREHVLLCLVPAFVIRQPGIGDEIPGSGSEEGAGVRGGERFGDDPGCVFVYGIAVICGYLSNGGGDRAGNGVFVFRAFD